jgi:hypothetical protein
MDDLLGSAITGKHSVNHSHTPLNAVGILNEMMDTQNGGPGKAFDRLDNL